MDIALFEISGFPKLSKIIINILIIVHKLSHQKTKRLNEYLGHKLNC